MSISRRQKDTTTTKSSFLTSSLLIGRPGEGGRGRTRGGLGLGDARAGVGGGRFGGASEGYF